MEVARLIAIRKSGHRPTGPLLINLTGTPLGFEWEIAVRQGDSLIWAIGLDVWVIADTTMQTLREFLAGFVNHKPKSIHLYLTDRGLAFRVWLFPKELGSPEHELEITQLSDWESAGFREQIDDRHSR